MIDSLVFSYWKHALTLLEIGLQHHNVRCARIDGDYSADERARALSEFRTNPDVKVLLLTFGTGSVGLTLTEATHVHLVEPHWNPMVEEQAIARAHRIGQEKPVTVWRYIVKNSIEENIVRKQKQKLYLAKIAHSSEEAKAGGGVRTGRSAKQDEEKLEGLLEECHLLQG
jgi:SNF2 family DNA or RNA helicase